MACLDSKKNLGVGRCADLPGLIRGMITTPADFRFTAADALDPEFWQEAIANASVSARIFLWPLFSRVPESISTETTYEDTPVSFQPVLDGRYRWRVNISKSLCFHKAAFTHRSNSDRVILIDAKNNFLYTYVGDVADEAQFAGFTLDTLNTENLQFNDGTVASSTPIVIALADPNEINDSVYGAVMSKAAFRGSLSPLTDVTITQVGAASATGLVVTVDVACDETPVSGLAATDFLSKDADDGSTNAVSSAVESPAGTYTLVLVGQEDGTIQLKPATALSIFPGAAYESNIAPVEVTP